ncbi:MAG TPA: pentapeptide repeat-containing protein [Thermoanaerobaculia bacterium]|nr:pentapeptide repeat-containing protein [Thermoanaerobaculia bacterium]
MKSSKKNLAERWTVESLRPIVQRLTTGGTIGPGASDIPLIDQEVDLRGIHLDLNSAPGVHVITDMRALHDQPVRRIVGARFQSVNFSFASLPNLWVESCEFTNVNFANADLSGWADHGNVFRNCTFEGASLESASLGHRGSTYTSCTFSRTKLRSTTFARPEFKGCAFADRRISDLDFFASSFERCAFSGRLEDLWFRGGYPAPAEAAEREFGKARPNRMLHVDFSAAELIGTTFSDGCDLSTCVLPRDDQVSRYSGWQSTVSIAEELVSDFFSGDDAVEAKTLLRAYRSDSRQEWYIINFRDVAAAVHDDEEFADRFRSLLTKANEAAAVA